jgi:hypothetical protein
LDVSLLKSDLDVSLCGHILIYSDLSDLPTSGQMFRFAFHPASEFSVISKHRENVEHGVVKVKYMPGGMD